MMFDEEGRKINIGLRIGMPLEGMSIAELDNYIEQLHNEIARAQTEKEKLKAHTAAAEALFGKGQ